MDLSIIEKKESVAVRRKEDDFSQILNEYKERVLQLCFSFLRNQEEAEETAQDVFVEVFQSLSRFEGRSKLSTWIYRITTRKCIDFLRKKKRKKRQVNFLKVFISDLSFYQKELSKSKTALDELEEQERVDYIYDCIQSLNDSQKTALTLSKFEGYKANEVAEIMGISISSVEAHLFRAKKILKKKLEEQQ